MTAERQLRSLEKSQGDFCLWLIKKSFRFFAYSLERQTTTTNDNSERKEKQKQLSILRQIVAELNFYNLSYEKNIQQVVRKFYFVDFLYFFGYN